MYPPTLELAPDSVTIYQMEIPYNTQIYQEMHAAGKLVAPVADWQTKRRWVAHALAELEQAGYTVASPTRPPRPARTRFVYRDSLWQGPTWSGLGVAFVLACQRHAFQNQHDFEPYVAALRAGELRSFRALTPTTEERLIRNWCCNSSSAAFATATFADKFGVDLKERFADALGHLSAEGFLVEEGDWLHLTRDGLLQVDRLVHDFFLPEHRHARYA